MSQTLAACQTSNILLSTHYLAHEALQIRGCTATHTSTHKNCARSARSVIRYVSEAVVMVQSKAWTPPRWFLCIKVLLVLVTCRAFLPFGLLMALGTLGPRSRQLGPVIRLCSSSGRCRQRHRRCCMHRSRRCECGERGSRGRCHAASAAGGVVHLPA
jgi:hypothetical protein